MTKKMKEFKVRIERNKMMKEKNEKKYDEKAEKCLKFVENLSQILKASYKLVGSCNQDESRYLVPKGTEDQISYYGKPEISFRCSDHWNWYSSEKKCRYVEYIQCYSVDMPKPRKREAEGQASRPQHGYQVALYWNGVYRHIYGEKWDSNTEKFIWIETDPMEVLQRYGIRP